MHAQFDTLIIIYYKFRGQLQPIRNLICYLQLPSIQIYMQCLEQQKKQIKPAIFEKLKGLKIQVSMLPLLVHNDLLVYQPFCIMNYLCRISMRQDLLGVDIFQKAKVLQILQIYYRKQPQSMLQLFRMSDQAVNSSQQAINNNLISTYQSVMNCSGYIKQICKYISQTGKYVFSNITVVDFCYIQSCIYMLGIFDKLDQMALQNILQTNNLKYLLIMREYKRRIENQLFYKRNQDYLQSFPIISNKTSEQRAKGLRKIWIGNPKLIK